MNRWNPIAAGAALVASLTLVAGAIDSRAEDRATDAPKPSVPAEQLPPAGIQWFATWTQGLREAKRTGRPILLVAAAPQCHDISGLW